MLSQAAKHIRSEAGHSEKNGNRFHARLFSLLWISTICPCARADSRQACITCCVFRAISGQAWLRVPDWTWSAKWRKRLVSLALGWLLLCSAVVQRRGGGSWL